MYYSETSINNRQVSEKPTTAVEQTKPVPPIALPIEIVHWKLKEADASLFQTTDSQYAPLERILSLSVQDYLREHIDIEFFRLKS